MTPAAPSTDFIQTSLPLAMPTHVEQRRTPLSNLHNGGRALPTPRMIKSVVDEAGLGKFVYLQGNSGRRYVFSSIRREQAALYDHALFAAAGRVPNGGHDVQIGSTLQELPQTCGSIYVHLLDDEDARGAETLHDLCGAGNILA